MQTSLPQFPRRKRGEIGEKEIAEMMALVGQSLPCIHINLIVSMHKYFNSFTIAVLGGPISYITLHILHRPKGKLRGGSGGGGRRLKTRLPHDASCAFFYNAHRLGAVLIYTTIMRV